MGRFFLIILALQSVGMLFSLISELYIGDLSIPYYEISEGINPKSEETIACQVMGFVATFCDYLSQFYALWFAVLIKQIIKDPIHKLQKIICFIHVLTFIIACVLTSILSRFNTFGVQEDLSCGVMFQTGLDDEVLMIIPFVLVPLQMYFVSKITRQTPFIIRQSLKRFVRKYTFYVVFLMSMQCMQVVIMVFGGRSPTYFNYDHPDGFKRLRYGYIILDHVTYACLIVCTIYEPVFVRKARRVIDKLLCIKRRRVRKMNPLLPSISPKKEGEGNNSGDEKSCSMVFIDGQNNLTSQRKSNSDDDSDSNFEEGSNQIEMRSEADIVDGEKFENLVTDYANFNEQFAHMSIKQKTSYFIINTVLMSICHCLIYATEQEEHDKNLGLGKGLINAVRGLTYQLKDDDIYHIVDMASFYKKNPHLCVSDVTNGQKVQIKVSEFERDTVQNIRHKSGYDDQFFLKSFAPKENHTQMTKFQIGSGKSNSFFFYTANNQFIIKTLKDDELKLLVRKGVLSKYYNHLRKNKGSLLARFYGIYTVKIKYMKPISVVIMDNLMGNHLTEIQRIYDLKGSTHKRITKKIKNLRTVRKDLNFLQDTEFFMKLTPDQQSNLKITLYKDKEFLKSCHLMDYSLLLICLKRSEWADNDSNNSGRLLKHSLYMQENENGKNEIEIQEVPIQNTFGPEGANRADVVLNMDNNDQDAKPPMRKSWKIIDNLDNSWDHDVQYGANLKPRVKEFIQHKNCNDPLTYYRFGIIDFLQEYTKKKKLETIYLRKRYNKKPMNCFSCVDPFTYGDRFYEFMLKNLFTQQRYFPDCEIEKDKKNLQSDNKDNKIIGSAISRKNTSSKSKK